MYASTYDQDEINRVVQMKSSQQTKSILRTARLANDLKPFQGHRLSLVDYNMGDVYPEGSESMCLGY
jgi:hypothetical protein